MEIPNAPEGVQPIRKRKLGPAVGISWAKLTRISSQDLASLNDDEKVVIKKIKLGDLQFDGEFQVVSEEWGDFDLQDRLNTMESEIQDLVQENGELKSKIQGLVQENGEFKAKIQGFVNLTRS